MVAFYYVGVSLRGLIIVINAVKIPAETKSIQHPLVVFNWVSTFVNEKINVLLFFKFK